MRLSKKSRLSRISAVCDKLNDDFAAVKFGGWSDSRAWDVNGSDSNFISPKELNFLTTRGAAEWMLDRLEDVNDTNDVNVYFGGLSALGKKIKSKSDYNKMCYLLNWLNSGSFNKDMAAVVVHRGKYNEVTNIVLFHN